MNRDIATKTKHGILWTTLFGGLRFVLRVTCSAIIARMLFPSDFGLMGLAMVVVAIGQQLTNFGLNVVLVQRKAITRDDIDNVFTLNLILMTLTGGAVILISPWVAAVFEREQLRLILLAVSLGFVIRAFVAVPTALLSREMRFRELGLVRMSDSITSLISPIILALSGLGVWSLVWGQLAGSVVCAFVGMYFSGWRPRIRLRIATIRNVVSFGLGMYTTQFLDLMAAKVDQIIVGQVLGVAPLGFYERAHNLMNLPRKNIQQALHNVLLSSYSRLQDENEDIVRMLSKVITTVSLVAFPFVTWFAFAAPSLILILFGPKWVQMTTAFQIMCVTGAIQTTTAMLVPVFNAKAVFRERIIRMLVFLAVFMAALLWGIQWGIVGAAWAVVAASVVRQLLLVGLLTKTLPMSLFDFFRAQFSSIVYAGTSAAVLFIFQNVASHHLPIDSLFMLILTTIVFGISLATVHFVLRFKDATDVMSSVRLEMRRFVRKRPETSAEPVALSKDLPRATEEAVP